MKAIIGFALFSFSLFASASEVTLACNVADGEEWNFSIRLILDDAGASKSSVHVDDVVWGVDKISSNVIRISIERKKWKQFLEINRVTLAFYGEFTDTKTGIAEPSSGTCQKAQAQI